MVSAALVIIGITASLIMSVCFPLLTYGSTLAIFGLAHVASELRFVDQRFGKRINYRFCIALAILLLGVIATRSTMVFGLAQASVAYNIELGLVVLLALSALLQVGLSTTTLVVASLLSVGFMLAPITTILCLAVLHNLTPMGFMLEIVPASSKARVFFLCVAIFLLIPLAIMSGVFSSIFEPIIGIHQDFTFLPAGPLERHLGVFLPISLQKKSWAYHAFSAITFAQCMHYLAVIYVMPKLINKLTPKNSIKPLAPWPRPVLFWIIITASTGSLAILYFQDFFWARSVYGIAAAVHAYLEIPILLTALAFTRNAAIAIGQPPSILR